MRVILTCAFVAQLIHNQVLANSETKMEKAMHKRFILAMVLFASLEMTSAHAQESSPGSPDEQTIRKSVDGYCDAFNSGNVDTLLTFWASDADYVDEEGEIHRGKAAIGALFNAAADDLKGQQLDLKIDTLRFVKPEVAIEDGTATLTDPDGESTSGRYTAVWIKNGDRWLISSARELPNDEDEAAASDSNATYLQPLEWLIGDWVSEDTGPTVNITATWALDKSFLVQNYTVAGEAGADLHVVQWIGFDPVTGQIKSWTFDSRGGYGEGLWNRDGNTWHGETTGVLPDGRIGTARNSVRFVDDTRFEWSSTGRNVEGQPMPDAEVRFVRNDSTENAQTQ
jgi:uncharacterized protein (TIGR02246 family)